MQSEKSEEVANDSKELATARENSVNDATDNEANEAKNGCCQWSRFEGNVTAQAYNLVSSVMFWVAASFL